MAGGLAASGKVRLDFDGDKVFAGLDTIVGKSQKVEKAARDIAIGFGVASTALIGLGSFAVKQFAGFEQAMKNVQAVSGATAAEFKMLSNYARDMSTVTIFSAEQSAQALYYLASAGFNAEQQMGTLRNVLDLAAATQSDLAFASSTVAATMNQFGISAENSARVGDVFTMAINKSQATLDKLATSMTYIGPVADSVGWSLEETVAALTRLYQAGFEGSMAGTILRGSLSALANPTKEAKDLIESLGISIQDVNPEFNNFADILDALNTVQIGLTESMIIFGDRAGTGMLQLLEGTTEGIRDMETALNGAKGAASQTASMMTDTLSGSLKLLKNNLDELLITIGEKLAPDFRKLVESTTSFANIIRGLDNATFNLIVTIGIWLGGISAAVVVLSTTSLIIMKLWSGLYALLPLLQSIASLASGAFLTAIGIYGSFAIGLAAIVAGLFGIGITAYGAISSWKQQTEALGQAKEAMDKYNKSLNENNKAQLEIRKTTAELNLLTLGDQIEKAFLMQSERIGELTRQYIKYADELDRVNIALFKLSGTETPPSPLPDGSGTGTGTGTGTPLPSAEDTRKALDSVISEYISYWGKLRTLGRLSNEDYLDQLQELRNDAVTQVGEQAKEVLALDIYIKDEKEKNLQEQTDFQYAELGRYRGILDEKLGILTQNYDDLLEIENTYGTDQSQALQDNLDGQFEILTFFYQSGLISAQEYYEGLDGLLDEHLKGIESGNKREDKALRVKEQQYQRTQSVLERGFNRLSDQLVQSGFDLQISLESITRAIMELIMKILARYMAEAIAAAMVSRAPLGPEASAAAAFEEKMFFMAAIAEALSTVFTADEGGFYDNQGQFKKLKQGGHFRLTDVLPWEIMVPKNDIIPFAQEVISHTYGGASTSVGSITQNFYITGGVDEILHELEDRSGELATIVEKGLYSRV